MLSIVPRLQIQPVALGHAEVMRQTVRNIRVDRALPLDDLVDSSGRKVDISGEAKDADSAGARNSSSMIRPGCNIESLLLCIESPYVYEIA